MPDIKMITRKPLLSFRQVPCGWGLDQLSDREPLVSMFVRRIGTNGIVFLRTFFLARWAGLLDGSTLSVADRGDAHRTVIKAETPFHAVVNRRGTAEIKVVPQFSDNVTSNPNPLYWISAIANFKNDDVFYMNDRIDHYLSHDFMAAIMGRLYSSIGRHTNQHVSATDQHV